MGRRHYVPMGRRDDIPIRRREDVPLRRHWVVSFETCLRRREDVPLKRLGDVPLRRRWVFHLSRTYDVTGTYRESRYDVATTSCCWVGCYYKHFLQIYYTHIYMFHAIL